MVEGGWDTGLGLVAPLWSRGEVGRPVLPAGAHVVLHIRLPDRPGGLGAVAARIGAIGADITDVSVARREVGSAVDVFHLTLPDADVDLLALLQGELREVDGARLERWSVSSCCCGA
jgi:hypothetical protein